MSNSDSYFSSVLFSTSFLVAAKWLVPLLSLLTVWPCRVRFLTYTFLISSKLLPAVNILSVFLFQPYCSHFTFSQVGQILRVKRCPWTPRSFLVDPVLWDCLLAPPCKLDLREDAVVHLKCTGELKCHSHKNILAWCDEYFTVGIFLVRAVSFPCARRCTYSGSALTVGG